MSERITADAADLDALAEQAEEAFEARVQGIIRDVVSGIVGTDWSGDVDPDTSRRWSEATRAVLRQLIENGTDRPDMTVIARDALRDAGISAGIEFIGSGNAASVYMGEARVWITDARDTDDMEGFVVGVYRDGDDEGRQEFHDNVPTMLAAVTKAVEDLTPPGLTRAQRATVAGTVTGDCEEHAVLAYRVSIATADEVERAATMTYNRALTLNSPDLAYPLAQLAMLVRYDDDGSEHDHVSVIDADGEFVASYEAQ